MELFFTYKQAVGDKQEWAMFTKLPRPNRQLWDPQLTNISLPHSLITGATVFCRQINLPTPRWETPYVSHFLHIQSSAQKPQIYPLQLRNNPFPPSHSTVNPRRNLLHLWSPSRDQWLRRKQKHRLVKPLLDGGCSWVKIFCLPAWQLPPTSSKPLLPCPFLISFSRVRGPIFLAGQKFIFCVSRSCTSLHKWSS